MRHEPVLTVHPRPVATTLLNLSIVLAGALAFMLLPVSPLPQVDFPAISVTATCPAPARRRWRQQRGDAARALARHHRRRQRDSSQQLAGLDPDHGPVRSRQGHQRRRARGAGRDQRQPVAAAERAAGDAGVPQDQPVAGADHDSGADLGTRDDQRDLRPGVDGARAEGRAGRPASATSRSAAVRCPRCASSCSPTR